MTRRPAETRPRIWAEGRQNPPFDLRAFARATALFTREGLSGLLGRCAVSAEGAAARVQAGALRIPENRLGRSGRYLPSHTRVGAALGWGAEVLRGAALAVNPLLAAAPPANSLFTAAPAPAPAPAAPAAAPARPRRPVRASAAAAQAAPQPATQGPASDPDLSAIRALLAEGAAAPTPAAPRPSAAAVPHSPAPRPVVLSDGQPDATGKGWRRALVRDMAATALGFGLLVVSLPYGAVRAALAHLGGQDLRELA